MMCGNIQQCGPDLQFENAETYTSTEMNTPSQQGSSSRFPHYGMLFQKWSERHSKERTETKGGRTEKGKEKIRCNVERGVRKRDPEIKAGGREQRVD